VPFHTAFRMNREQADAMMLDRFERVALGIVFGELEGAKFNWSDFAWEKPK